MSLTSLLQGTQNITVDEFHVNYLSVAKSSCIVHIIVCTDQVSINHHMTLVGLQLALAAAPLACAPPAAAAVLTDDDATRRKHPYTRRKMMKMMMKMKYNLQTLRDFDQNCFMNK